MLSEGQDIVATSKIMGHSTTQITANTYSHVLDAHKKKASNVINKALE